MSNEIRIPDIGDFDAVDVIEVLIKAGDTVEVGQSVLVLESDKASMEVPTEIAGKVDRVAVRVGDKVKQGDLALEDDTILAWDRNDEPQHLRQKRHKRRLLPR